MSQVDQTPPPASSSMFSDERQMAAIAYILFIAPLGGLTHIVGIVLAYVARPNAPPWVQTHYTYLIRTFWIGLAAFLLSALLCLVLIGFVLLPIVLIWVAVRCVVGLIRLSQGEAILQPRTWTI